MGYLTSYGADHLLDLLSNNAVSHDALYIALINGELPGINAAGDEMDEVTGAGYSRAEIQNYSGNWDSSLGALSNTTVFTYPSAEEDWGRIAGWAICSDQIGGQIFFAGSFCEPFFVVKDNIVEIPVGGISIVIESESSGDQ